MKKIVLILTTSMCIAGVSQAQQCMSLKETCSYKELKDSIVTDSTNKSKTIKVPDKEKQSPRIGFMGISGNFSSESFEKLNAGGKLTAYARLMENTTSNLTFYLSFNKNITRTDTLYNPSLLFPDLGNTAFDGTLQYSYRIHEDAEGNGHYLVPFVEGWVKDFKIGKTDTSQKRFVTMNYTAGLQYVFHTESDDEKNNAFFSASLYYTHNKIQSKDNDDFQKLARKSQFANPMPLSYNYLGLKLALQYNEFQFYFDARSISGNEQKIPDKDLRGFNYSIGFITTLNPFGSK